MNITYISQLLAVKVSLPFAGMAKKGPMKLLSWTILERHLVI